jgi:hypothetical protein
MASFSCDTFFPVSDKSIGDKDTIVSYLSTNQQGHYYRGDPKIEKGKKNAVVQVGGITECAAVFIYHNSWPMVHVYHAPPGSFPGEDSSDATVQGNIDRDFFTKLSSYVEKWTTPGKGCVIPTGMNIGIVSKSIGSSRQKYLSKRVQEIFFPTDNTPASADEEKEKINIISFDCFGVYSPDCFLQTTISIDNWKSIDEKVNNQIVVSFSLNLQVIQVLCKSNEPIFAYFQNKWIEIQKAVIPTIMKYV